MIGGNIAGQFVQPIHEIARSLGRIAAEMHTANQLKWLSMRATPKGFASSDGPLLVQVGRKVGATQDERG